MKSTARKLHIVQPEQFEFQLDVQPCQMPQLASNYVAPKSWTEDTTLRTQNGKVRQRLGSLQDACQLMGGLDPKTMNAILKTGLIFAFQPVAKKQSRWRIDLAGVLLYRENRRRANQGKPPTQQWKEYSEYMARLNADDPEISGPPPVE